MRLLGWDIGGSNTKVCRVDDGAVAEACSRAFEVKDAPDELPRVLRALAAEVVGDAPIDAHAVTMTAELSRHYTTKREGVEHVIAAMRQAFPSPAALHVFTVSGTFVAPDAAASSALAIASANWMATALVVAASVADAVLIDVGSTTTDIIPIARGQVVNVGSTDPERLASGELLYTGAFRTPVEGLAHEVSIGRVTTGIAAEAFATSGDVYVWLGDVDAAACQWPTADGRPAGKLFAGERLRRAVCADAESMPARDVQLLAQALADAQVARIATAIGRVRGRHTSISRAVVVGHGGFIGERAARACGLEIETVADGRDAMTSRCAPAAAVALLLDRALRAGGITAAGMPMPFAPPHRIERVVKIGGRLLAHPQALQAVMRDLLDAQALVVPGGGPFADAVRSVYAANALDDSAAHWMAVLAMDQYAELLVSAFPQAVRVETLDEARDALWRHLVPVLAPSRWLRRANPLPHSWDVTSDSIAAWVAGQAGASSLLLVKAPGATGQLVDAYFDTALPPGIACDVVPASERPRLRLALGLYP